MEIIYGYICCFFGFVLHCIAVSLLFHTIRCVLVFCCVRLHRNNVIGISSARNRQYHKIMMHRHQTPHFVRFAYSIAYRQLRNSFRGRKPSLCPSIHSKVTNWPTRIESVWLCVNKLISQTKNCLDGKNKWREWKTVRVVTHFERFSWKSLMHECKVVGTTSTKFCTKHIQAASASVSRYLKF